MRAPRLLCDPNGKPSFARVGALLLIALAYLGVILNREPGAVVGAAAAAAVSIVARTRDGGEA